MISDVFPDLFRYQFLHWLSMSLGIDFGSLLWPFSYQIIYCFVIVCWWFVESMFYRLCTKLAPKRSGRYRRCSVLVRILLPHTCTFYLRKTYKCPKSCFPIIIMFHFHFISFSTKEKELIQPFTTVRPTSAPWPLSTIYKINNFLNQPT